MKELSERNWTLIEMGLKTTGSFTDAYLFIEEQLYMDEAATILKFLKWCEFHKKNIGRSNYQQVFKQFRNEQEDKEYNKFEKFWKEWIGGKQA